MSFYPPPHTPPTFHAFLRSFAQDPDLPLGDAVPQERLQQLAQQHSVTFGQTPGAVYTVAVTLWAFCGQCLSFNKSCFAAVARVLALRLSLGLPACSDNTGAYCNARAKLPVPFLQALCYEVADGLSSNTPPEWLWKGHRVFIADGTTLSAPDTAANQAEYPQHGTQKAGLGFPIIRLVVLLGVALATIQGAATGAYQGKGSGETSLLRTLFDRLQPGDVLLGDSYYCTWWLIAALHQRDVPVVLRQYGARKQSDFRSGTVLGPDDHVVEWTKPTQCPIGLDQATYDALPTTLKVREVRVRVTQPGFRTDTFVVVTTLLDADLYSLEDLADLYRLRWHVELDIRAIKQTLKMDILRGQTPDMLRREIWGHLLAYNLIRQQMTQAALTAGCRPRQLSFAHAVTLYNEFRSDLRSLQGAAWQHLVKALWQALGGHRVGDRPDRYEPRAVKRRPKSQKYLTQTRAAARAALLETAASE